MQSFQILLIDDHAMFRTGLRVVLETQVEGAQVAEAESLAATLEMDLIPDLILLDIQLSGLSGLDAIKSLKKRWPDVAIIMVSAHHDAPNIDLAYDMGAVGFISKREKTDNIIDVINSVRCGNHLVAASPRAGTNAPDERPQLTPRQCDVLELLCQGYSNKIIGRKLGLTENTVRWHVQAILETLQVSSRSEAIVMARSKGLIH